MMRSMPHYRRQTGFSLIELVLTVVVTAIVALPLSLTVQANVQGAYQAQDQMFAQQLGRREMERVNKMPYAGMVTASFPNYQGYPYDVTRTVTFLQGNAGSAESLKQITVDVRKAGSPAILASFVTYFARNIAYGI